MAASNATTTGIDAGDLRRRNVGNGQPNGSFVPAKVGEQLDEKTKQKVRIACLQHEKMAYCA